MPYIPNQKQRDWNNAQIAAGNRGPRPMSDEEAANAQPMSDEEAMSVGADGPMTDEEAAGGDVVYDDRDWREKGRGYALNVLNIPTFGMGSELVAGAESLMGRGDYESNLKEAERTHQRYRELEDDWSWGNLASGAAGLVGSALPFGAMYKGAKGLVSLGGRVAPTTRVGKVAQEIGALGATGGIAGELQAVGEAEGNLGERMEQTGYAAPTAAAAMAAVGGRVIPNVAMGSVIGAAAPAVTRGGQRLMMILKDPKNKAARYLAEKLIASGKTIDEVADDWGKAQATGKPVALVDTAPAGMRDAATSSARMPGPGRDRALPFIEQRVEGQTGRMSDDIARANGKTPGSFIQTADDLAADRANASRPLYERAFEGNKPVMGPKIVELTNRPSGKQALNQGLRMAQDEGIPMSELVIRDAAGNVTGYTTKGLHYGKMALDDMIESAKRKGDMQAARNLTKLKNDWLAEMDRANPAYKVARDTFAGHSANKSALEAGRDATKLHPDQIRSDMAKMGPGEQEFYKQGFMQRTIEEIEASPDRANAVNRIFGTQQKRDRMRAVLGDEKYNELSQRFGVETKMHQTHVDVGAGSQTAQRQAAQGDMDTAIAGMSPEAAGGFWKSMMTGDITPLLNSMGMRGVANLLQGINQKARGEIVAMMFSDDPAKVKAALALIQKHHKAALKFNQFQQNVGVAGAATEEGRQAGGATAAAATGLAGAVNPL